MPYKIVKKTGSKPYKIINKLTKQIVGSSSSLAKAKRSIGYRMTAKGEA